MRKSNIKLKKFLLRAVTVLSVITILAVGGGTLFVRLYLKPRLGVDVKDAVTMTKYLTDGQTLANLKNFDKQSAKEVLSVMLEINDEEGEALPEQTAGELWHSGIAESALTIPSATKKTAKEFGAEHGVEVTKKQETAYDRIMAAATPEEISAGMAIISKVDLAKVKELQKETSSVPLKKYLKQVLTSSEISKALSLYNKYRHLL